MTASGKIEKVQTHFQALSQIASSLNTASDDLTSSVEILNESLKKLNVGLTVWVVFRNRDVDQPHLYDQDEIGYCKVSGEWGIALRRVCGNMEDDLHSTEGLWLFNDAPREMRLTAADELPALIERLAKEAFETTRRVQEKAQQVRELALAISNSPVTEKVWTPHYQLKVDAKMKAKGEMIANLLPTKKDGGK
jgi:hypothetical protein